MGNLMLYTNGILLKQEEGHIGVRGHIRLKEEQRIHRITIRAGFISEAVGTEDAARRGLIGYG